MTVARFLADTNVVIAMLSGHPEAVELVSRHGAQFTETAISQITRIELLSYPALTPELRWEIVELLAHMQVINVNADIERAAISLRRRHRLDLADAIIGATARVHGLELLTLDAHLADVLAEA